MITTTTAGPSFSVDPVASAVAAATAPVAFGHADRSDEPVSGAGPLDIERLYPTLAAAQEPAAGTALAAAAGHVLRALQLLAGESIAIR